MDGRGLCLPAILQCKERSDGGPVVVSHNSSQLKWRGYRKQQCNYVRNQIFEVVILYLQVQIACSTALYTGLLIFTYQVCMNSIMLTVSTIQISHHTVQRALSVQHAVVYIPGLWLTPVTRNL